MKVLHVEAGKHLYGGALQVVFLLGGLREQGGAHILACPVGSAIAEAAQGVATRVHEIEMRGDADVGMVGRLRRLIRQERPDLVHLHSRRGSDVWGAIAARLEGVPVVLSRRVDNPEPRWLVPLKYRLYHRVITISEGIREVLLRQGVPQDKVVCVHSAVDTQRYEPGCQDRAWFREEFGVREGELTLAMAAQFIPRKGHHTLIEALPAVLATQPNVRVLLFGQGPKEGEIRNLAKQKQLEDRIVFAGFRRDLHRVLPCVDVMVHPASMEGLGVALLQAAACGVPIVAGRAGGIPEIVRPGVNGELVSPEDPAALAAALLPLLRDEMLRLRYGSAGRKLVVSEFSIPAMVAGNASVYQEVQSTAGDGLRRRPL
ncbi:MAG TPA: glycosyltransferase [Burkholderiaceae bacterium]|nr:glycosyltransferase [Burkholderiaceae bacterium]